MDERILDSIIENLRKNKCFKEKEKEIVLKKCLWEESWFLIDPQGRETLILPEEGEGE